MERVVFSRKRIESGLRMGNGYYIFLLRRVLIIQYATSDMIAYVINNKTVPCVPKAPPHI